MRAISSLYAASLLHSGLVIQLPTVGRDPQRKLFRAALDELGGDREPIDQVLGLDLDGEEVIVILCDPPAGEP